MLESEYIKLREVFVPYLMTAIGTVVVYVVFRWIFDFQLGILPFKYEVTGIILPLIFVVIAVHVLLRRRIRILDVNGKGNNGYFLYQFIIVAAIIIPLLISQYYMEKSSFDLVKIHSVGEIKNQRNEKYFKIRSFIVDQEASLPYVKSIVSGRTNENLRFHLFFACPFENAESVWYGVDYSENLSNRLSDERLDREYERFIEQSLEEFEAYDLQKVEYFEQLRNSEDWDGFVYAITDGFPDFVPSEQIVLVPINEPFEDRAGNSFFWIFGSFGISAFVVFMMTIVPKINKKELNNFKKGIPLSDDPIKEVMLFLNPGGTYKATSWLIIANTLMIVIMMFDGISIMYPPARELLAYGGNRRLEVLEGEYWRLLTAVFLHGGLVHLILNMVGLGLSGLFLEKVVGPAKLVLSFLICGILASIASIYWHVDVVSIGASGAIFGLLGIILIFSLSGIYPEYTSGFILPFLLMYAGFGLLMGFIAGYDNPAHIGGLISGIFLGGIYILMDKEKLIENASPRSRRKRIQKSDL